MIVRILVVIILVLIAGYIVRDVRLLRASTHLFAISDQFPHQYQVGSTDDPPFLCVVLGDSTMAGSGVERYEETLPYLIATHIAEQKHLVRVINVAQSGARIADVAEKQWPEVQKLLPDLVLVSVGANDATHFTSLKDYTSSIEALVQDFSQLSHARVVWATAPDMHTIPALPKVLTYFVGKRSQQQNALVQRKTAKDTFVILANIYDEAKLDYDKDHSLYAPDLFHPSAKGYTLWADVSVRAVDTTK